MSLRTRLLVVLGSLILGGLVVADFATTSTLRRSLVGRVDDRLTSITPFFVRSLADPNDQSGRTVARGPLARPTGRQRGAELPDGSFIQILGANGAVLRTTSIANTEIDVKQIRVPVAVTHSATTQVTLRTASVSGGLDSPYRLAVTRASNGQTVVVGEPLTEVQATLDRLIGTELVVSGIVLLVAGGLGWLLIGLGLRPLDQIGETAAHIAAGDLSRRVEPATSRTEVGRLGVSLNDMLTQIEAAFAERQASEDRLRRFVADASHELRTPLTSIRGYAELFRRGAADNPVDLAMVMDRIEGESSRMGMLVEDLLLLARLDQGRPLEMSPVDVSEIAANVVADSTVVAPSHSIRFVPSDDQPVWVLGDAARLHQVVANLVGNAMAHTPPGTDVEVSLTADTGDVTIQVSDNGPGMEPGDLAHVFERFYRADPSRTRASGGVGLGLSIADMIVEAHHGHLRASSTPGNGATFTVTLPAFVGSTPSLSAV